MKKKILLASIVIIILALSLFYIGYNSIWKSNVSKDGVIFVKSQTTFEELLVALKPYVNQEKTFRILSNKMNFDTPKSGRYEIKKGTNNLQLIRKLRAGWQDPIKISFNNQDTFEKLAGRLAQQIEADSVSLLEAFTDERFITENGFDKQTALAMYLPNSYEVYWNISPIKFRDRMLKNYKQFWTVNRKEKAAKLNLTPIEVQILASIVQKETAHSSERKTVAGLYLNRLKNKMMLQADPTVIFAARQVKGQNFEMKRVLFKDLEIDSPYNTYKITGLPPGLIAMPDISSIDAVLQPENHDYYYMCASVTDFGTHVFAKTLAQHNVNAAKYQKWVQQQGY